MQAVFRCVLLAAVAVAGACSSGPPVVTAAPPADPEETIHNFMNAVRTNNLVSMSALWGTRDGPAARRMDRQTLEQRLVVIRTYLMHDAYEVSADSEGTVLTVSESERRYRVRITRRGCTPTVPFTVVQTRTGWLISNIDLAEAGNPARSCIGQ